MASQQALPLNKVAEQAVEDFRACEGTIRVDPRSCAIDPHNRQATLMSGKRVHTLIASIVKAGFSEKKATHSVIVDVDPKRLPLIMEHNRKTLDGDALLPNFRQSVQTDFYCLAHQSFDHDRSLFS